MMSAAKSKGMKGTIYITQPIELGAHVLEIHPQDVDETVKVFK